MKAVGLRLAVLVTILTGSACGGDSDRSSASPTSVESTNAATPRIPCAPAGSEPQGLTSGLALDGGRSEFRMGEVISFTLTLVNCGSEPISRHYPDQQRYEFTVSKVEGDEIGEEVWRWSAGRIFAQVIGAERFETNDVVRYTEIWHQVDNAGRSVSSGRYDVLGIDVGCEDEALTRCHFGPGVYFDIVP
jgi:hypothetical protein